MNLVVGHDVIEIQRVKAAIDRYGERFLKRVFTDLELSLSEGRVESLAGRFAAKEAVAKALRTGIGPVSWVDIQILSDPTHAPVVHLGGEAEILAEAQGLRVWSVSISHEREIASAVVIGWDQIS